MEKSTLAILRQMEGLKIDDKSEDNLFARRDPIENLRKLVTWEFGSPAWADIILSWAEDLGMVVTNKTKER